MLQFNVLGTLEIKVDGKAVAVPRGPKVRQLLSLLVMQPGSVVSHGSLVDELWGRQPPKTALSTVRTHVYHLRKMLGQATGGAVPPDLIGTWSTGYVLHAAPEQVDAEVFQRLTRQGEALLKAGDLTEGSRLLSHTLQTWDGDVLADVTCGPVLSRHVQHLAEVYMRALQQRIGADMQLGRHRSVAAELRSLVARHPMDEWLHGQLITALYRCDRRADALRAYQELRTILRDELGLDPSPALQHMQRLILSGTGGDGLDGPARRGPSGPRPVTRGGAGLSRDFPAPEPAASLSFREAAAVGA
ncbi:BTAD domain-containing putative transcriptional regulator [Streptomyces sp. NPDC001262]|uniref:AfsR/SARP family transcriptional regulator n=1 Tax=Streptomyces sp. NPDC001262 TaxID=3364552 RepID=UPI0036930A12